MKKGLGNLVCVSLNAHDCENGESTLMHRKYIRNTIFLIYTNLTS